MTQTATIIGQAMQGVLEFIQLRELQPFDKADPEYGKGIAAGVGVKTPGSH